MTDVQAGETLKKNRFPQEPHKLVRLFWNNGFLIYQRPDTLIAFQEYRMKQQEETLVRQYNLHLIHFFLKSHNTNLHYKSEQKHAQLQI